MESPHLSPLGTRQRLFLAMSDKYLLGTNESIRSPTLGTTLFQANLLCLHAVSGTYSLWSFCEFPFLLIGLLIAIRDLFPPGHCSDSGSRDQRDTYTNSVGLGVSVSRSSVLSFHHHAPPIQPPC